jgi:hypothetical protein
MIRKIQAAVVLFITIAIVSVLITDKKQPMPLPKPCGGACIGDQTYGSQPYGFKKLSQRDELLLHEHILYYKP